MRVEPIHYMEHMGCVWPVLLLFIMILVPRWQQACAVSSVLVSVLLLAIVSCNLNTFTRVLHYF